MARVTITQTNFTAGEVSPRCFGRVDVARYQNGAKHLRNCIVNIHGGAERRDGSLFVAGTKHHAQRSRLIPYVFSTTQAYVLEFGHLYMRVYVQSGGQVMAGPDPYEIATPYSADMVQELDYTQGADTMFIFHGAVAIHTLRRLAPDNWVLSPAPFTVTPFAEIGDRFGASLTLSDASTGTGRSVTASAGTFLAGDVGRHITYLSGRAKITAVASATSATAQILAAFPDVAVPADDWILEDSPQTTITPSAKDPVGAAVTLLADADSFRAGDVGKYLRINSGLVLITAVADVQNATGTIKEELSAAVGSPPSAWSLERAVWNDTDGYPCTGAMYEQRLVAAGSPRYPQTVWGSRSGLFFDFTIGTNDDDAFSFSLPSTGQINPIQRMASAKALIPFTYGGEYTMEGGVEKPLSPTNVQAKSPSVYGSGTVKPCRVGNEVLFVQRAGKKLRAMAYRIGADTYSAPDLTVLADHLTQAGIVDMCYQQEPRSILWCVRSDGMLATMTIDRDESVIAWTPQGTAGEYESVASIPNADGDEVWAIVKRTAGGQTRRYVERFQPEIYADSTILGASVPGTDTWSGLDHLEGLTVAARADDVFVGTFEVTGGQIVLPRAAHAVQIGLPYTVEVTLLRPELQYGEGSAQGNAQRVHEVSLLFMDTIGAKLNGDVISFREFGSDLLDVPPAALSGMKRAGLTEWSRGDAEITIAQDEPNPFHLLSVVRKLTVNS
ncbi:MAG TPA: hypothetical protein VNS29_15215 [Burkholderiaceae bacterium]|nr:hypothetical protein [Burkholderiaceae bacterium]